MNELVAALLRASQHRLIGRLARDPELRSFPSGSCVANARILINRPGAKRDDGQQPDAFQLEVWGEEGQAFVDHCRKGQLVDVTGRIRIESWTDRNGEPRHGMTLTAEEWGLVESGAASAPAPAPPAASAAVHPALTAAGWAPPQQAQPVAWNSQPSNDLDDDDIPF